MSFNPHARKERDYAGQDARPKALVSIHTPARSVTILAIKYDNYAQFQSTRPQGA